MTTSSANGRAQRKSLAEQIDRLDTILDGFADGLNEAVADAVREAVSKAVEAALNEILTSAELHKRLREQQAAARRGAARKLWGHLVGVVKAGWSWAASLPQRLQQKAAKVLAAAQECRQSLARRARGSLTAFARRVWFGGVLAVALARRCRGPLLVAAAVGLVVGAGCYLAGPAVASAVSGLAGGVASLASGLAGLIGSLIATWLGRLRYLLRRRALRMPPKTKKVTMPYAKFQDTTPTIIASTVTHENRPPVSGVKVRRRARNRRAG